MSPRQQKITLAVVGVLAVATFWFRVGPDLFSGAGGGGGSSASSRDAGLKAFLSKGEVIELASLEKSAHTYRPGRDPFGFGERPKPPPPKPVIQAPKPIPVKPVERPPVRPSKPQPPPIELSYLGNFGPVARRIAVLTDGETIYNARIGEVVDSKFIVREIGYESVDLAFVDFPDFPAQKLPLGG